MNKIRINLYIYNIRKFRKRKILQALCLFPSLSETDKSKRYRRDKMAASNHTVLQFNAPSTVSLSAKVDPLVIFNICDCYVRRPDQAERVIGTLLGSVLPDGTVDICNSFAVPHTESSEQVALDIEYHHNMLVSHQKVNPKEVIVGWYSAGLGVTGGSALIHDFYSREVPNPVHLTVDTAFRNGEGTIKAYFSVNLALGDLQLAAQFQEIPLDLRMLEAKRLGLDILKTTVVDKLPNDLEGMEVTMERLLALIDDVYKYVDDVVEGRVAADNSIGRFIADTAVSLPKLSPSAFDKLVNDSLQDQLLLLYLSSIIRTQLGLAEKLNTAADQIL
ncbi:eukaryotic translation initiation factor 3 subunit F-like [Herrania umbratica]|uniref:Eukaryotic translation initiation factor 3 subunit F n=1 Tax=Herrania umbratica TaxID=108875 RepID=A0A6J1AW33_9ROSI|nr:eukaryotic translation initiation factor 3 subunit F-like [Herrania umbratica]